MKNARLTWCYTLWDECLRARPLSPDLFEGRRHMTSVSEIAGSLARLRGVDEELARIAGYYHDLWAVETGIRKDHAHHGATRARELLENAKALDAAPLFTKKELDDICAAIYFHSDKDLVHLSLGEVLKDADLLDRFLDSPDYDPGKKSRERLVRLRAELGDLQTAARRLRGAAHV